MSAISSALVGFDRAQAQLNNTANRLANVASPAGDEASVDTVDLSDEILSLIGARNTANLSVAVARTAQDLDKTSLSLFG